MFWSGVSDFYAIQSQNAAVDALLDRLRPSLAILGDARRPTGAAALVDAGRRLYLAHNDAVQGDTIQAKVGEWRVSLRVLGQDERTGLVILALRSDAPPTTAPAILVADSAPEGGSKVCLVFAQGGLAGTYVGGQQFLIVDKKPLVPVSEIRFENPQQLVGGALVMTFDGKLVGAMGATVARPGNASSVSLKALADVKIAMTGGSELARDFAGMQRFNPGPLTVAYTPTLMLIRRSVGGLLSDGHRPDYAALGIQVSDAPGGGATIRRVVTDSPAQRSGIRVGDVLLAMGDRPIRNQFDFVEALLSFHGGDAMPLRLRHGKTEREVEVTLAHTKS